MNAKLGKYLVLSKFKCIHKACGYIFFGNYVCYIVFFNNFVLKI